MCSNRNLLRILAALAVTFAAGCGSRSVTAQPEGFAIRLDKETFIVAGIDDANLKALAGERKLEEWAGLFEVKVGKDPSVPAMVGSYRVGDGVVRFVPRFPLQPGLHYRAVFDPARLPQPAPAKALSAGFDIPKPDAKPAAFVRSVYPSGDLLPENLLRFYVHFSGPMSRGDVYRHVHLFRDEDGKAVELPFLELDEEFWDREQTRFTLFIDPGRIKREVKPREDLGPVFEAGKGYTLVIDQAWQDARGVAMTGPFRKKFKSGPPDHVQPSPKNWKLQAERGAVRVTFPEPLDHAMLLNKLHVADAAGKPVEGAFAVHDGETRWTFTPSRPLAPGGYALVIDTVLEDRSGNSVARPFELDVFHPIQKQVETKTVEMKFEVP